jgi:hypothetical protein
MNRMSIAAFVVTVGAIVPAGWRSLEADIQTDGPALRPARGSIVIGDATVAIDVDRGVMRSGDTVSAVLVATADHPHAVSVDVTALEDEGYGEERVPNPPSVVGRHKIKLQAAPGGGPPVVASFSLGSRRTKLKARAKWYTVYATAPGHGMPSESTIQPEDAAVGFGVAVWTGNTIPISIEPPAIIPAEGPFTVAVRVKNTTKDPLDWIDFDLGGAINGWDGLDQHLSLGGTDDYDIMRVEDGDPAETLLAPTAERLAIFRIIPKHPNVTHFTLVASARAGYQLGAMETLSFDRPKPEAEPELPAVAVQ